VFELVVLVMPGQKVKVIGCKIVCTIELRTLDTYAGKYLSYAAIDV
jgi:hypothetical protein